MDNLTLCNFESKKSKRFRNTVYLSKYLVPQQSYYLKWIPLSIFRAVLIYDSRLLIARIRYIQFSECQPDNSGPPSFLKRALILKF